MKKIVIITLTLLYVFSLTTQGQTGTIKGQVVDKSNGESLPFANVTLFSSNNSKIAATMSDLDGKYAISTIDPGTYILECDYVGYQPTRINNIIVSANKITFVDVKMQQGIDLKEFEMISYEVPLISKDQTSSGGTVTREDIRTMPGRSASSVANTIGGVTVVTNYNIRGSRSSETENYIDGIRVRGSANKPSSISVYRESENNESYGQFVENSYQNVRKNPLSTFSIDVDRASYTNIRRYINQGSLPPTDAVRIEEMINYFNYNYSAPENNDLFSITTEYTDCPWNTEHKLVHIGLKGVEVDMKDSPANNLVFLIDVSGSMNSPDKLPLLKSGLNLLIDQLRDQDRVSIVVYAGAAGVVLPSTKGNKKDVIKDVIDQLSAGGSTAGGAGINLAYQIAKDHYIKDGNNRVILATDGDFNVGVSDDRALISLIEEKRNDNIFLSVLGFGTGNLKDSKMEQLANKGNGNYNYIDNALEAKKVLVTELGGTLLTIAKDVKIQIEFNPAFVKSYRLIGYENRKLNDEDFNDDKKDAGELGSGHTVTALYEIVPKDSKEQLTNIDELKYQNTSEAIVSDAYHEEVLTIKFRYKKPKEDKSELVSKVLFNNNTKLTEANKDCQFSIAVAQFGMLLRNSKYKGNVTYESIITLAKLAKGEDDNGYRAEFIRMVEMAELIK